MVMGNLKSLGMEAWVGGIGHKSRLWIMIGALGLMLASCGPSKTAQCREILQTIQQAESGRAYGNQNRQTYEINAQIYQTLADDLESMTIRHRALRDHQAQLVEAYRGLVTSINSFIEASDDEGRLSYVVGDSEAEAKVNAIEAAQMQAYNRVSLALELFYNTCAN